MPSTKLVQVFLSQSMVPGPSIYEVSSDNKTSALYCTCPGFKGRSTCKHVKFVQARIESNNGTYPLEISSKATKEEAAAARGSDTLFREFILKYGKIEVF